MGFPKQIHPSKPVTVWHISRSSGISGGLQLENRRREFHQAWHLAGVFTG